MAFVSIAAAFPPVPAEPDEDGFEVFLDAELLYLALVSDPPSHSSRPAARFRFRPKLLVDVALLSISILAAWSTLPSH